MRIMHLPAIPVAAHLREECIELYFERDVRALRASPPVWFFVGHINYDGRDYSAARIQALQRSIALAQRSDVSTTLLLLPLTSARTKDPACSTKGLG